MNQQGCSLGSNSDFSSRVGCVGCLSMTFNQRFYPSMCWVPQLEIRAKVGDMPLIFWKSNINLSFVRRACEFEVKTVWVGLLVELYPATFT